MRRVAIRPEQVSPCVIWGSYETQRSAVLLKREAVLRSRPGVSGELPDSRFRGKAPEDILAHFDLVLTEMGHQIGLSLLAAAEAVIRVDFFDCVYSRKKDSGSRLLRRLYSVKNGRKSRRIRLGDILAVWASESPRSRKPIASFRGALQYRHWLAHGRYWVPKLGMPYLPRTVRQIVDDLLDALDFT